VNPLQWLIEYSPLAWLNTLSAHQLDTVRTASIAIGSALVPIATFLLGWGIRILRRVRADGVVTREQTSVGERVTGELHPVGVAEIARDAAEHARHAVVSGEATRQEISDLGGWMRGAGRRRQPTGAVPSIYEGEPNDR
jgi:hypothetical protein